MSAAPIHMMSKAEWGKFVDRPFNPPDDSVSDDDFANEFYAVEDGLRAVLAGFGEEDAYGQADFYLDNGCERTRGMGFELGERPGLERPEVVSAIRNYLVSIPHSYDIAIHGMNFDFYLYISQDRIQAYTDDLTRLSAFGLAPAQVQE